MAAQPFSAVQPAVQQTAQLLFRPFRLGRWLLLGFLCLLQTCAGMGFGGGSGGSFRVPIPPIGDIAAPAETEEEPAASPAEELREVEDWIRRHLPIIVAVGAVILLFVLALVIVFQWLGAHAVFCYLDAALSGRNEVARPWREHAPLAASFFRLRLLLAVVGLAGVVAIAVPLVLIVLGVVRQQARPLAPWEMLPLLAGIPALLLWVAVLVVFVVLCALVGLFLYDFVAPLQYLRRIRCAAACRLAWSLVRAEPVAFLLYLILKVLLALALGMAAFTAMCCTCCLAALPYVSQVVLQPLHLFHRLLPVHFLRQFGSEFDLLRRT